jgi:hypothetical protein
MAQGSVSTWPHNLTILVVTRFFGVLTQRHDGTCLSMANPTSEPHTDNQTPTVMESRRAAWLFFLATRLVHGAVAACATLLSSSGTYARLIPRRQKTACQNSQLCTYTLSPLLQEEKAPTPTIPISQKSTLHPYTQPRPWGSPQLVDA